MPASAGRPPRLRWTLTLAHRELADARVIAVSGRLATTTATAFEQGLERLCADETSRVVLDLSGVDYVSSAGLAVLERATSRLHRAGRRLEVCGLQEPVRMSLEVSGAAASLHISGDVCNEGRPAERDT